MTRAERIAGCLLGLALGDAFGAPYEGGPLERLVWRLIGRADGRRRWTDDTRMTLDIAETLLEDGDLDPDRLAGRFAASYRWSRGYGPGAARTLKAIRRGMDWRKASRLAHADGSLGNGAAMRAPILGVLDGADVDRLDAVNRATAAITHAHPEGIEGARLIGRWVAALAQGDDPQEAFESLPGHFAEPFDRQLQTAHGLLGAELDPSQVRRELGSGITARSSCVTAVLAGTAFADRDFPDLLDFVRRLRGDVDTISAMAGAGWGTHRGASALPAEMLDNLEAREMIADTAVRLAALQVGRPQ